SCRGIERHQGFVLSMHRGQVGRDCLQDANRRGLVVHEYASLAPRRNLTPKNHRISFRINAILFEEADYMLLCPAFEFKHSGYDSAFRARPDNLSGSLLSK